MRYPVTNYKTEWNNTAGYRFGDVTPYGFHDGDDINDNAGGDSDLGKPLFAIADGQVVYYHTAKHPVTGFGYHHVYKITGSWGTRWVHEAHCQPGLIAAVQDVKEGQQIAKLGKSGTQYAHVHFAIFKVDPASLPNGIDTVANTKTQLNAWWEDPTAFIEKHINGGEQSDRYYRDLYHNQLNSISQKVGVNQDDPNRDVLILQKIDELLKRPTSCPVAEDPRRLQALKQIQTIINAL